MSLETVKAFLDTSFVARYLTGNPPEAATEAAQVIDRGDALLISGVALAETAYVLTTVYRMPRRNVVDSLIEFVQKTNVSTFGLEKDLVLQGLLMCRPSGRVSFADALIWAAARSAGAGVVYSLDERFPGDGLEIRPGLIER